MWWIDVWLVCSDSEVATNLCVDLLYKRHSACVFVCVCVFDCFSKQHYNYIYYHGRRFQWNTHIFCSLNAFTAMSIRTRGSSRWCSTNSTMAPGAWMFEANILFCRMCVGRVFHAVAFLWLYVFCSGSMCFLWLMEVSLVPDSGGNLSKMSLNVHTVKWCKLWFWIWMTWHT